MDAKRHWEMRHELQRAGVNLNHIPADQIAVLHFTWRLQGDDAAREWADQYRRDRKHAA